MLSALEGVGASLLRYQSERLISDFVSCANTTPDVIAFARLHVRLTEISEARRRGGWHAALPLMIDLRHALRRAGSPFWIVLSIQTANVYFETAEHEKCLKEVTEAEATIDLRSYPFESARFQWIAGLAYISLGHVPEALQAYRRAIEIYERVGDRTQIGAVQILLAEHAAYVGNHRLAWKLALTALANTSSYGEPSRVTLVLDVLARELGRYSYLDISIAIHELVIARTEHSPDHALRFLALAHRCRLNAALQRRDDAISDCVRARSIWNSQLDETERARLEPFIELAEAATLSNDAERRARLDRAVAVSLQRADRFGLPAALRARAQFHESQKDLIAAKADLQEAVGWIERQRNELAADADRIAYLDLYANLYRDLVRVNVRSGSHEEALAIAERLSGRSLVEQFGGPTPNARTLAEIRRSLDAETVLLYLWSDADTTFLWLIEHDSVAFRESAIPQRVLTSQIAQLTEDPDESRGNVVLWEALFQPFADELRRFRRLVIVAPGGLDVIPFAALHPLGGKPLIEQTSVIVAPSATFYVEMRAHRKPTLRSALLVANSGGSTDARERLDTSREIAAISAAFAHVTILAQDNATPTQALIDSAAHDLLHFSTHGLDSSPRYGEPVLLLARGLDGADEALRASSVAQQHLRKGTVVILAACRTLRGEEKSEGTLSMARAFLAAGAGVTVATLWDVDDQSTAYLFAMFYRAVADGSDPADALRFAQRALIRNPSFHLPHHWAGFQLYGGI